MEHLGETLRQLWVLWLMALFVGIVLWALWPSNKSKLERYGHIPLNDDSSEAFDAHKD
ncbi:MAG: cbb3-type cytochrome c oxidase subunit 3 [Pseudomonadota bacterium]